MRRGLFGLLLLVSLYLFLAPVSSPGPEGSDKVGHVAVFAVLALAGRWADVPRWPLAAGLVAYAVLTEVLQAALPLGRYGDPADVAADVVGVALGLLLWEAVRRLSARAARPAARSRSPRPG